MINFLHVLRHVKRAVRREEEGEGRQAGRGGNVWEQVERKGGQTEQLQQGKHVYTVRSAGICSLPRTSLHSPLVFYTAPTSPYTHTQSSLYTIPL